jgi:hypothetical protein
MYSVLRIRYSEGANPEKVAADINRIIPGSCEGPDRERGRMSCSVADAAQWKAHLEQIRCHVEKIMGGLKHYGDATSSREIDIMIEPEDIGDQAYTEYTLSLDFLGWIISKKIELTITVCQPGDSK